LAANSLVTSAFEEVELPNERILAEAGVTGFEDLLAAPKVSMFFWLQLFELTDAV
jgi:hypothetical protein